MSERLVPCRVSRFGEAQKSPAPERHFTRKPWMESTSSSSPSATAATPRVLRPPVLDFSRTDEDLQADCRRVLDFRENLSPVVAIRNHGVDFRGEARRKAAELEAERGAATGACVVLWCAPARPCSERRLLHVALARSLSLLPEPPSIYLRAENRNVEFASHDDSTLIGVDRVGNTEKDLAFRQKVEALSYRCARVLSAGALTKEVLQEKGASLGGRLTLRHYPRGGNGVLGAHVDGNLFTLLWSDRPGLEVLDPEVGSRRKCVCVCVCVCVFLGARACACVRASGGRGPGSFTTPAHRAMPAADANQTQTAVPGGRRAVRPADVLAMGLPSIGPAAGGGEGEEMPPVLREEDWIVVGNGKRGDEAATVAEAATATATATVTAAAAAAAGEAPRDRDLLLTPGLGWHRGTDGGALQRALPVACPVLHRVRVPTSTSGGKRREGEEEGEGEGREERFSLPYLARILEPF